MNLFGREAQIRLHIAAALAHTVYLGLLEIYTHRSCCIAYDSGNGEDTLSTHAC